MNFKVQLIVLFLYTETQMWCCGASIYLHEPSFLVIRPDEESGSDFGFSIGYQDGGQANLVVGAPHTADSIGKVYSCPLKNVLNRPPSCTRIPIDLDMFAPDTLKGFIHPKQSFCLGASIAATPEIMLTCAPLWSTKVPYYSGTPPRASNNTWYAIASGTCFVYDGKISHRYLGPLEQQKLSAKRPHTNYPDFLRGGTGWTTLVDKTSNLVLIAKQTPLMGDVAYFNLSRPTQPTESLVLNQNIVYQYLKDYSNIGHGLAMGNFFSHTNETYYAISMDSDKIGTGEVIFLTELRTMLKEFGNPVTLSGPSGTMFGAAMCAADVSADGLADLLVAAPAHSDDHEGYDTGALFIYLGGDMKTIGRTKDRKRLILGSKDGSRFGTAIATSDVDGDGLPEIFISAPYEDVERSSDSGAIYVLSGLDVKNTFINYKEFKVSVAELRLTQRVQITGFRAFGFSLQVVRDVDENGCDEIAVGAPSSSAVILLKCIPTVNATVSTRLLNTVVREYDRNFTVLVCVNVKYHPKPVNISTQLSVTCKVNNQGNGAAIANPNFTADLSLRKESYCENITVQFRYNESGHYDFTAELDTLLLHEDAYTSSKADFNSSWVTLSPYSKTTSDHLYVTRHCADDDCSTRLNMFLKWAGTNASAVNYTLGCSETENMTVVVRNEGGAAYDGCVRVRASGAHVSSVACGRDHAGAGAYRCYLPRPMQRNDEYQINVVLNMSKYTNLDSELHIEALLYPTCNHESHNRTELNVNLMLNAEDIHVTGSSHNMNITDTELINEKTKTINDTHEYTIVNERSVKWIDDVAVITWRKEPFIDKYRVSTTQNTICIDQQKEHVVEFHCTLELMPHSSVKIIATTEILKREIVKNLHRNRIDVSSNFTLSLRPTSETIRKSLTTVIFYQKELSVANNKWIIILIAVLLALIVLGTVVFILYKVGFFKRETKERLDSFKQNVRRRSQSVRQCEPGTSKSNSIAKDENEIDDIDMVVLDDCPFEAVDAQQCPTKTAVHAALIVGDGQNESRKSQS